jgi:hypothetical protein
LNKPSASGLSGQNDQELSTWGGVQLRARSGSERYPQKMGIVSRRKALAHKGLAFVIATI